jgi:hypothetical protein
MRPIDDRVSAVVAADGTAILGASSEPKVTVHKGHRNAVAANGRPPIDARNAQRASAAMTATATSELSPYYRC